MEGSNDSRTAILSPEEQRRLDVELGAALRRARVAHGMTREALGAACGVSGQQIDKYESGTNRVALSRLLALSIALRVPLTELIPRVDGTRADAAPSQRVKAAALARTCLELEPEALDHLLGLAKALVRPARRA